MSSRKVKKRRKREPPIPVRVNIDPDPNPLQCQSSRRLSFVKIRRNKSVRLQVLEIHTPILRLG
jgi:hypothetical protein